MFVQSKSTISFQQKNGVALRQRRAQSETLVQWESGEQRWVETADLMGTIRLVDTGSTHDDQEVSYE